MAHSAGNAEVRNTALNSGDRMMDGYIAPGVSIEQNTPLIDIATRNVIRLAPGDSMGEAARIMAEKRISSIMVMDENNLPVGIATERDMLRAMQSGCPPETALREIMSSPITAMAGSVTCLEAYRICLRDGIRHLAIIDDDGHVSGVVSETDFRMHINLAALAGHRQVASVMNRSVSNLSPDAGLRDALNLMQSHRDTCVVVVEDGRPVGIVTERDIVRLYSGDPGRDNIPVGEIMTSPVLTLTLDSTINEAAGRMLAARVRHLVVVDREGRMAGLICEHGLTHSMALSLIDDKLIAEGAFLHTLVNTIPDMVWLKDVNGAYLACNPRFGHFFGAQEKDIVGKTDYDFVSRELADIFRAHDRIAMEKNGVSVNEEWVTFADDGHRELLETIKTPMRDGAGKLIGVLGIARDITARMQAENALAESEYRYRMLVENSPFCIHEIDLDGRLQSVNRTGLNMLGLDDEQKIRGVPYLSAISERDSGRIKALMQDAFDGAASYFEFVAAGDTPLYFKSCFIPIKDAGGKVLKLMGITEDITERKRAEDELLRHKQLSDDIINSLPGIFYMLDAGGRFARVNPQFLAVTGYTKQELEGMTALDLFAGNDKNRIAQRIQEVFNAGVSWAEAELITKSGRNIPYYFTGHRIVIDGQLYLIGLGTDITERKRAEENLRITASVFDNSQEAVVISDANNAIVDVNPAFSRITGYSREEVLGKNPKLLSSGRQDQAFYAAMWQALKQDRSWRGEIWNRRKSGEVYAEMLSVSAICDDAGKVLRYVAVFSDISHLKAHEAELSRVAYYDALTGIPNRALLADRMKQAIAQTAREQFMMAVCYIDLDGFKQVNDTLGHEAGDQVLIEVAKRIGATIRGGDTVARLGGDEFVVVLLGLERGDECVATLERLLAAIAQPITVKEQQCEVSASIGVSIYPLDDEAPDTLLRHADQAMYVAKQSGKDRYYIYDPALDLRARGQYEFLKSVRLALQNNQFELYYQPKVDLRSKQLVGAEALIRWHHPERGLLAPAEFLHAVENTELDIELGDWVIAAALAQNEGWRRAGLDIEVSINVSAHHLESHRFAEKLQQQIALYPDMPPGRFQIEVLETAALNDFAIVRKIIETCRKLGVRFALDDFGTGYSSLSYLSHLPVDVLKIDQSFVHHMLEDKGDNAIIKGVLAMAQAFNRQTVVEGIENEGQYRALLDMGCEIGQGYAIARPMQADELVNWKAG